MTWESSGIEDQELETISIDNSFEDFIVRRVSWSVLAALTKNHDEQQKPMSHNLRGWKSEIRVLMWLNSAESSFLCFRLLNFCCIM